MQQPKDTELAGSNVPPAYLSGGRLLALAVLADAIGAETLARDARALSERVAEERFFVACIGQFKRGKSSLLNALVQAVVLPVGVVPVTAVVTVIRHGLTRRAAVRFANGACHEISIDSVVQYVTEERNPGNKKGVAVVEIFVPSALLSSGMCLVDTPGIGSVFASNTAVTREFVPHIDAALVVLGADPPISGEELALIGEVARQVSEMIFVLNKADRLTERDCDEAVKFARDTLMKRIGHRLNRVFRVSACEWLNQSNGSGPLREELELLSELDRLANESGAKLVKAAELRGFGRLSVLLLSEFDRLRAALLRPVEESSRVVEHLSGTIADAERSLNDLGYLFKAEQDRVSGKCSERREKFLAQALPLALKEFHEAMAQVGEVSRSALNDRAAGLADEISKRWLDHWLTEERPTAERLYSQSAKRFVGMTNEFLERLAASDDDAFIGLPRSITAEMGFTKETRLYYITHFEFPRRTFLDLLTGLFRTRQGQLAWIELKVGRYLNSLLSINSTRILNDLNEQVRESARRLEAKIRSRLKEIHESARRTLHHASQKQTEGAEAVRNEVERIESLRSSLSELQADLAQNEYSSSVG